jgi:hypothetical protein
MARSREKASSNSVGITAPQYGRQTILPNAKKENKQYILHGN